MQDQIGELMRMVMGTAVYLGIPVCILFFIGYRIRYTRRSWTSGAGHAAGRFAGINRAAGTGTSGRKAAQKQCQR